MGRRPTTIASSINGFVRYLEANPGYYSPRTVRFYKEHCNTVFNRLLVSYDDKVLPQTVTAEHVQWFLAEMQKRHYAVKTRKLYICALKKICEYYGNDVFAQVKYRFPADMRPNVDWLSDAEVKQLLDVPKTAKEELIVHCGLCLGLRRVEITRLRVQDIHDGYLDVLGKGAGGGKPRSVPFHRDTQAVIDRYMQHRASLIEQFFLDHPLMRNVVIPDNLMIWTSRKSVNAYNSDKGSGIDKILQNLCNVLGFHFTSHTLRRTFGRLLYRAGVSLAVISKIYGHESEGVTYRYLGLDMDDMSGAMELYPF